MNYSVKIIFNKVVYERSLLHVFQTLIQEIMIHQDGTIDIVYTFEIS